MRFRFWVSQLIWIFAVGVAAIAPSVTTNSTIAAFFIPMLVGFFLSGLLMNWGAPQQRTRADNLGLTTMVRAGATVTLWITYLGLIGFALSEIGWVTVPLAFILFIPLLASNYLMWRGRRGDDSEEMSFNFDFSADDDSREKRKRDRIDSVLRDLSDDDLVRLRERLADGTIDDEVLYEKIVGDDGELVDFN